MDSSERVDFLFNDRTDQPYQGIDSSSYTYWQPRYQEAEATHLVYSAGTVTNSWETSETVSDSSLPSTYSNATTIPPNPPVFNLAPPVYAYYLHCEFDIIGCRVRFNPSETENFLSHSISHFAGREPPAVASCTFCDDEYAIFRSNGNRVANWRSRMMHIVGHFRNFQREEEQRPDYWVINYMRKHHLISSEDYDVLKGWTQRPAGCKVVHPGYKTDEMLRKEYRESLNVDDIDKEERRRRKQRDGKSRTHHQSQKG